ncbi:MAG: hypothetical protein JSV21_07645 [Nitrospirota bacterium]|nr:MAG: hypothetical protein JSV21_07645 [Nitrospirota bacterium]
MLLNNGRISVPTPGFLIALAFLILLAACTAGMSVRQQFAVQYVDYNNYLRWGEFDKMKVFMTGELQQDLADRIKKGSDIKISDVRELKVQYEEGSNDAEVEVEIEYYRQSSGRVKKAIYLQKWIYIEENGVKAWRVRSLPPGFD